MGKRETGCGQREGNCRLPPPLLLRSEQEKGGPEVFFLLLFFCQQDRKQGPSPPLPPPLLLLAGQETGARSSSSSSASNGEGASSSEGGEQVEVPAAVRAREAPARGPSSPSSSVSNNEGQDRLAAAGAAVGGGASVGPKRAPEGAYPSTGQGQCQPPVRHNIRVMNVLGRIKQPNVRRGKQTGLRMAPNGLQTASNGRQMGEKARGPTFIPWAD
ncbi:hypothetical protein Taro_002918 [Colocasia esculenta]|uniref:Uncharacterized protein n=1 Tax=Colocasia esculenta TaxID=4460 RepID=A0A843TK82_COLES|nr:hypothetical protein [Colocasia esculenta]